ncbi:conserved secreted protein [Mycobacterium tuberculosis]|nr:conserved secreted protein [Mycobacterium tuberculosis]
MRSTLSGTLRPMPSRRPSDIVENAGHIIRGDIAGGASGIVKDSIDIATHAVDRTKEVFTGKTDDEG